MKDENEYLLNHYYDTFYSCVNIMKMFITLHSKQNIPQCAGFCHPGLTE